MRCKVVKLSIFLASLAMVGCAAAPNSQTSSLQRSAGTCTPSQVGRYQALYSPSGFYMIDTETGQMWHRQLDGWVIDGTPVTRPAP